MATARSPSSGGPPSTKTTPPRTTPTQGEKKLPMNKIVVGQAPSPNIREVKSKIGSMQNINHRPGGGNVRVETKKIDISQAKSKVGSVDNITYKPGGGDKKIYNKKIDWKAAPKVGSMENATHKPGGGNKKIDVLKLDFKERAQSKVGSKDNIKHVPGGGAKQSPFSMSPLPPHEGQTPSSEDAALDDKLSAVATEAEQ